jgi:hypothetical protein
VTEDKEEFSKISQCASKRNKNLGSGGTYPRKASSGN